MTATQRFTGMDRSIDLRYPSNRFALLVAVVAGVVAAVLGGGWLTIVSSLGWAFATWALGRELDPDAPLTAGIASALIVALIALHPESRALAFPALCATGVLMLTARGALNSTGRALTAGDLVAVALAPVVADLLTGLPLRLLGVSSLGALYGRGAKAWSLGLAALGLLWLVVATVIPGLSPPFSSALNNPVSGSIPMALALVVLGGFHLFRGLPSAKADNGASLKLEAWRTMHGAVFGGAILTALFTPWTLWVSLGLVGLIAILLERSGTRSETAQA